MGASEYASELIDLCRLGRCDSHFWLFDGAEGGTYVEAVQRAYDESDEDGDDDEAGSEGEGAVGGEEEGSD